MKDYLTGAIGESLRRAEILQRRIPSPLPAPELLGVAEHCRLRLEQDIKTLNSILEDPSFGDPDYFRIHLRIFRRVVRSLFELEVYGLPALARFSEDERFLTRLLFQIHQEVAFPLAPPIAACFASDYYGTYPKTNVMYVPLVESETLLHLPDLCHEMAHLLVYHINDARVAGFRSHYERCRQIIDQQYRQQVARRRTSGSPRGYIQLEEHFRRQWLDSWLEEMVCDLFAVFTLGPAFAWAHLHLVAKRGRNVFWLSYNQPATHPADDARMKALLVSLNLLGFQSEAELIDQRWRHLIELLGHVREPEYHLAYPDELIEGIAVEVHRGVDALGCHMNNKGSSSTRNSRSVVSLLSEAWQKFWEDPGSYRRWEDEQIRIWRSRLP